MPCSMTGEPNFIPRPCRRLRARFLTRSRSLRTSVAASSQATSDSAAMMVVTANQRVAFGRGLPNGRNRPCRTSQLI